MKSVLLFSFEPFLRWKSNSSIELGRNIKRSFSENKYLKYIELPVVFEEAGRIVTAELRKNHYDYVVGLGQNSKAKKISFERIALNIKHAKRKDNAGNKPYDELINVGSPLALETTIPYRKLFKEIKGIKTSLELSYFAGTYVCNNVLFIILDSVGRGKIKTEVGFFHIPRIINKGKLSLENLTLTMERIISRIMHQ